MGVRSRIPILACAALAAAAPARAQTPAPPAEPLDRVVAIAGDSVVLQSELVEELLRMQALGQTLPRDSAALDRLRRQLLEQKVNELLLVQAAERDSIVVESAEVDARVDEFIRDRQRALGGEQAFLDALRADGLSLAEYRELIARDVRRGLLIQQYMAKLQRDRRPPPVSEDEIRRFFESQKELLGRRPATITFYQVVVAPRPADSARARALARAEEILGRIRAGEDFAQLARRYSDDPGTRERGGDLGWFRPSQMVPEFAAAVSRLRPGELSGIVETSFGFHIIRLERIRGAERQARHILIRPEITEADVARARALADSLAGRLRAGDSADELAGKFGDPAEERRVGPYPRDRLPPPYRTELAGAEAGAVVGPFALEGEGAAPKWAVVKVTEVAEEGEYSLADPAVRSQVREQLERQKLLDEIVRELRRRTHVEIRL